ncbi:hypothetical protein NXZ84_05750 [Mechercharimyces sp. CAU 1602]|nr:hypothetical protein [Mechercharimyces sp. CAU 1602]
MSYGKPAACFRPMDKMTVVWGVLCSDMMREDRRTQRRMIVR